jgi:hypothetical protein
VARPDLADQYFEGRSAQRPKLSFLGNRTGRVATMTSDLDIYRVARILIDADAYAAG